MLRLAVLLLLLANVGYYSWSNGMLAPWGFAPPVEGEPERLMQQIAPEALHIVPSADGANAAAPSETRQAPRPAPAPAPAPADLETPTPSATVNGASSPGEPVTSTDPAPSPGVCLQAGPMSEARATAVRGALAVLPAGSWIMETGELPGRWMVYMGRFADDEALAKKRAELRALKVDYDRPGNALEPGLSLGRFATEEAAQRGLSDLAARGVRTARVVRERAAETRHTLRLPAATPAMRERINGLAIAWGDTPLQPCK